jgi:hypothetical protein
MAFIYDLSDTWNNAGISFNGIKLNATDTASASGSKLIDLQINGASKFTVGKTGAVIATGLIESTVGGFRFPDGTTQTTKATVNSVSGTGTVNGITLTGSVTDSGSLTLGGTLGNIANNQLTNSAITINGTSTPLGGSIAVGTVTSVAGTGTVSGLSLTGSVTTSGSLTLGGTLVLTSGQVTDGLGYTPYNATNPAGYTTNVGTVTSVAGTGTVNGLTLTGSVTTSGSLTLGGTLGNIANSQLTNSAITINGTSTALGGSISVGTVTSVAALTLGTSGTDLSSSVANGTTTPVVTLNVPTASAANRGALSPSDWSTFNAKQAALVSGTNIKTVGGASLLGSGDVGTIGLAYGGTGATTESGARTALGLGTAAVLNAAVANGVATLDGSGTVPTSQLPGAVLGGLNYQGTWNASTNVPTLASSTGSKGYYYVVSTAGSTNLNGITDWKIGDWAVYDGTAWQKVDNTDAVSSVNGYTGAVVLSTSDVAQGTNLYFTQAAARDSVSAGTGISYNSTTGVITNSAPDQTVALTGAGTTTVTGTYPNFTITSNDSTVGTVTSVAASGGTTGLTFTGSPITTAGTLTLGGTLAVANGGTGATTLTSGYLVKGNGTSAVSASVVYDNGTNVGIGTASPGFKLQVEGTIRANSGDVQAYQGAISTYGVAGTAAVKLFQNSGNWEINNPGGYLQFYNATAAAERMRVTANGDVLINTTASLYGFASNPSLELNGAAGAVLGLKVGGVAGSYIQHSGDLTIANTTANNMRLFTNNTERMRITSAGNVGIGASAPATRLHVEGADTELRVQSTTSANGYIRFINTSGSMSIGMSGAATNTLLTYDRTNSQTAHEYLGGASGYHSWSTNGAERMRITSAGNVGIGMTSIGAKLDITSGAALSMRITGPSNVYQDITDGTGTLRMQLLSSSPFLASIGAYPFILATNNTERMRISSGGAVSIGTSSALGGKLNVFGGYVLVQNGAGAAQGVFGSTSTTVDVEAVGANAVRINTNSAERMRIDSSGNLGLGVVPSAWYTANNFNNFDIGAAGGISGRNQGIALYANAYVSAALANVYKTNFYALQYSMQADTGSHVWYTAPSGTAGTAISFTQAMTLDASGNLLVGATSNPYGDKALINGSLSVFGPQLNIRAGTSGVTPFEFVNRVGGGFDFYVNNATNLAARITSAGNVGIGTSAPVNNANRATLALQGAWGGQLDIMVGSAVHAQFGTDNFDTGQSCRIQSLDGIVFKAGGATERMRIDSSGQVGIGTTAPISGYQLTMEGVGAYAALRCVSAAGFSALSGFDGATQRWSVGQLGFGGNNGLGFYVGNSTEVGRFDASGNLLVGTASSTYNFSGRGLIEVNGTFDSLMAWKVNNTPRLYIQAATGGEAYIVAPSNPLVLQTGAAVPMQFLTNNAERMRIDSSGNVMIGGTTANSKLDVNGDITLRNGSGITIGFAFNNDGWMDYAGSANVNGAQMSHPGTVRFLTNSAERMRIDSGGNVAIGSTATAAKLNVVQGASGTYGSAGIWVSDNATTSTLINTVSSGLSGMWSSGSLAFGTGGNNFTERMRIDSAGELLVGTTLSTAGRKLDVRGGNVFFLGTHAYGSFNENSNSALWNIRGNQYCNSCISFTEAAVADRWAIGIRAGETALIFAADTNDIHAGTERMRLTGSGHLLVGKTAVAITTVGGEMRSDGGISSTRSGSTNATSTFEVYSTGAGAYRFFVDMAGNVNATSTSISAISDIRLKENVRDLDTGLDTILALKPRRFDWKEGKGKDVKDDMGFIAQEVETVLPELVGGWKAGEGEPDDLKSVKAGDLIPVLVKAIQELTARVAQLEGN